MSAKLIVQCCVVLLCTFARQLSAQANASATPQITVVHSDPLFANVGLTPDQQAQIVAIHDSATTILKQRLNAVPAGQGRPDFSTFRDSVWAQMRLVLTTTQQTTFDTNLTAVRQKLVAAGTASKAKPQDTDTGTVNPAVGTP
jgi:hypothetical protein